MRTKTWFLGSGIVALSMGGVLPASCYAAAEAGGQAKPVPAVLRTTDVGSDQAPVQQVDHRRRYRRHWHRGGRGFSFGIGPLYFDYGRGYYPYRHRYYYRDYYGPYYYDGYYYRPYHRHRYYYYWD